MIDGKRILGMACQNSLKILNRRVVIEIVVMLESDLIQRIGRPELSRNGWFGSHQNRCQIKRGKNQQDDGSRSWAMPEEEEKHAHVV